MRVVVEIDRKKMMNVLRKTRKVVLDYKRDNEDRDML
jgi:hypothetical protein